MEKIKKRREPPVFHLRYDGEKFHEEDVKKMALAILDHLSKDYGKIDKIEITTLDSIPPDFSPSGENLIEKAKRIATEVHKNQFRLDKVTPYITHPENVVNLLIGVGIRNQDTLSAGYLHDVPEDTSMTIEYIGREFKPNIARIVRHLTKDVDREQYKERIKNADYDVQIIKLADILDNCSDLTAPYLPEDLVRRKIEDCKSLYLPLAKKICPEFYSMLLDRIDGINGFSKEDWLNGVYCKEKS